MEKNEIEIQQLLDIISDLRREMNVLNTAFCYLPFSFRGEQMQATIKALEYEARNEKYDQKQRDAFKRIASEIEMRTKGEFINL